jgi:hypothetical protein
MIMRMIIVDTEREVEREGEAERTSGNASHLDEEDVGWELELDLLLDHLDPLAVLVLTKDRDPAVLLAAGEVGSSKQVDRGKKTSRQ